MAKHRKLSWTAISFAACSPAVTAGDSGVDAGRDGGSDTRPDAGLDAGYDAGAPDAGRPDAGACPCINSRTGNCAIPPDFPPDAATFLIEAACQCFDIPVAVCPDETPLRCFSWACFPRRAADGGVERLPDGGPECLC